MRWPLGVSNKTNWSEKPEKRNIKCHERQKGSDLEMFLKWSKDDASKPNTGVSCRSGVSDRAWNKRKE